jgi:predicted dehydrogenase
MNTAACPRLINLLLFIMVTAFSADQVTGQEKITVALAGLSHDHVNGVLQRYRDQQIQLSGIAEANPDLVKRYQQRFHLPDSLFYKDLPTLLKHRKPDAVMAFNAISEHAGVVEICAPLHIHVMVEKPLAVTVKQAERMAALAKQYNIHLLTNYETTWYASNQFIYRKVNDSSSIGEIRKIVVHDGHQGPKEIGVSKEFFEWLTDPEKNGAGALVDFGCYGANLMTWLMKGQQPIAVTAVTHRFKPAIYPKVDDDALIIVEYPTATGVIEASWNWPFNIKDMEIFAVNGYVQAMNPNTIRTKTGNNGAYITSQLSPPAAPYQDYIPYLTAVLKGELDSSGDLSSLENNIIVVKILEAAKRSAKEGRRIVLGK